LRWRRRKRREEEKQEKEEDGGTEERSKQMEAARPLFGLLARDPPRDRLVNDKDVIRLVSMKSFTVPVSKM
jgi:hypothetical protein